MNLRYLELLLLLLSLWLREFTNPKARARTEYIEMVVTGIYYKTNIYTTDPRL